MSRLARFELRKLWGRPGFLLTLGALLLLNLLLLWYLTRTGGQTPELSSYRALAEDLAPLSEREKELFLEQLNRDLQGAGLVNDVLHFRALGGELGDALAQQAMAENPGVFEQ